MEQSRQTDPAVYILAEAKVKEIEAELKRLNRWDHVPLPKEKFENIGAFGADTMRFEQWIQFILIPRVREIVRTKGEFPESSLSRYAFRIFRDDTESDNLHELLYELDIIANEHRDPKIKPLWIEKDKVPGATSSPVHRENPPVIAFAGSGIPPVLFRLSEVLPQFRDADLESQLQTFDIFLAMISPSLRVPISELLLKAASETSDPVTRLRIEKAAKDVASGSRAAEPYDHEQSMKDYIEQHRKNFPRSPEK